MAGIRVGKITLFLEKIPNRKGLAFVFQKEGVIYPIAYVLSKNKEKAEKLWEEMLGELR